MLSLNDTADVMAQNLSQNFVLHGRVGLASDRVPKLSLNHAERAFDIRAKMVSLQERLSMVVVAVEHLRPQTTSGVSRIALEGDQGAGPYSINRFQVVLRGISKISRYFRDIEVGGCVIEKGWEHGAIICIWPVDLNRRDDVGSHTTHDVGLNPSPLDSFFAVLVVEPTVKSRRGETGRVTGKTCLPGLQGQTALGDKIYENGGDSFGFQSVENRVVARQFADESIAVGCPEIAHKPTPRDRGVYFEDGREKGIRNGDWPSSFLGASWFGNTSAEILEQDLEVVFFVGLCSVVSRPVLTGGSYGFTLSIPILFAYPALNEPFCCVLNNTRVIGAGEIELSLVHGDGPFLNCKGRGPKIEGAGLLRCRVRLAGYGLVGCYKHPAGPVKTLAEDAGFEPADRSWSADYRSAPINHSGNPPSISFLFLSHFNFDAILGPDRGFYPDFTDTSKKADNGPRRCVISKRRKYSAEFKREAVALANDPSVTQSQIAQELGISANMLGRWSREVKELGTQVFGGQGKPRDEEITRLKRELARVKKERDFLKEAAAFFAKESR